MAQYIDKDALVVEIDRQIELLKPFLGACAGQIVAEANDKLSVLEELKNFLDTLEVKEVDLEKEIEEWIKYGPHTSFPWCTIPDAIKITAEHFFELGRSVSNKAQKGEEV